MDNNKLRNEIALRVSDPSYKEFDKTIYERALYRAQRFIARKYQLVNRFIEDTLQIPIPIGSNEDEYLEQEYGKDIVLSLPSFVAETSVIINGIGYTKTNTVESNKYEYLLYRDENKLLFNYSPRTKSDILQLSFISDLNLEDEDIEEIKAVIPVQYEEEVISEALIEVSKLGIVKFSDSKLGEKYAAVLKLYGRNREELDKHLIKNSAWISVKPWRIYD